MAEQINEVKRTEYNNTITYYSKRQKKLITRTYKSYYTPKGRKQGKRVEDDEKRKILIEFANSNFIIKDCAEKCGLTMYHVRKVLSSILPKEKDGEAAT